MESRLRRSQRRVFARMRAVRDAAGVAAFSGPTPEVVLAPRFAHQARDIAAYRPAVPASLDAVVRKAMATAPADRFRSAGELAQALSAIELHSTDASAGRASVLVSYGAERFARKPILRHVSAHPWRAAAVGVALVAGAVFAYKAVTGGSFALGERDWVLVGDFEGPPDDKPLSAAVRELVTAELNQSRSVGTVSRQQLNSVMRLAGVAETTHVDAELGRQLATRSSVRAIVAGSIQRIGENRYSVALQSQRRLGSNLFRGNIQHRCGSRREIAHGARRAPSIGRAPEDIAASFPSWKAATHPPAYQKYLEEC